MNRKSLLFGGLCLLWLLACGGGVAWWHMSGERLPPAPETLGAAKCRVEAAGYHVPDNPNNPQGGDFSHVVTLSRGPMTWEDQSGLVLSSPKEAWAGKARIYLIRSSQVEVHDVDMKPGLITVMWGKHLIVGGDPDLVNEIIRLEPLPFESKVQNKR